LCHSLPAAALISSRGSKLSEHLGQQFYIENIAGAGGNIGTGQAARARPDGYTVLFAYGSFVVNPSIYAKTPYDPQKDFAPVTLAVVAPTVLVVNPAVPATSVKDLVALIKANPGKYSYASGGVGAQGHLVGEQLRLSLGLDLVGIPFSGAGPARRHHIRAHPRRTSSSILQNLVFGTHSSLNGCRASCRTQAKS
jgi:tripartite-type tricarboxylate transporter receptor subunit TctC